MDGNQGAPTFPWSRLPHIGHPLQSPIPQPHQAPTKPQPSQALFTPRFRATTDGPPPPNANQPPLIPTNVVAPPTPSSAPQQLLAKATIQLPFSPVVSKDPQSGDRATSGIISCTPTPTSPPPENHRRSQRKTSTALSCCFL
ncbi:hypothetical protein OSB04_011847 [Centaurea solstitialis]|uniref:Uncharacterized protein n=1 Tax=Centaurea solstitialis TaxID=347529 RepID=A0AA38TA91_9ASTR|nr:hypothetical protein OSB04_011847 [Centaurea solstitialis]